MEIGDRASQEEQLIGILKGEKLDRARDPQLALDPLWELPGVQHLLDGILRMAGPIFFHEMSQDPLSAAKVVWTEPRCHCMHGI